MLRRVWCLVKDFLFPVFCVGCEREGVWFCDQCKRRTSIRPFVFYPPVFDIDYGVLSFFPYIARSVWGKLISAWKYSSIEEMASEWDWLIGQQKSCIVGYLDNFPKEQLLYLLPIPLHKRRERERGFNQSVILADIIKKYLLLWGFKVEIINDLKRLCYTKQQAKLEPKERRLNLSGAFIWSTKNNPPENIVLVDDVLTTGYTAQECIKVLRLKGVKRIGMITLAHG